MQHVNLPDQVYQEAARQAKEAGFQSVEDYFTDLVQHDPDNFDARFTSKVIEALDKVSAEVDAGRFFTPEEVDARHSKRREEWLRTHKS